jgi:hypothetical protein
MLKSCPAWVGVLVSAATLSVSSLASADQPLQRASVVTTSPQVSCQAAKCNPNFPSKITSELAQLSPDYCAMPVQANLDFYAWREFIALNWPADTGTCSADLEKTLLDSTGPRVWQTWLSGSEVMVPNGSQPSAWCAASRTNQTQTFNSKDTLQPVGGVLIDQNGRFARYETRLNEDTYNYLVTNNLWNKAGQKNAQVNLPTGPKDLLCNGQCCGATGAIQVKASWKVLGPNDDKSRFYTLQAILLDDGSKPSSDKKTPPPTQLGLVGLHIAHKTASQKKWIWSTFEHVDNVTKLFNNPQCPQTPSYNPNAPVPCTQTCCPPNSQTAAKDAKTHTYVELSPAGKPLNRPTQLTRVLAITDPQANEQFKALLKGSVWENYELVSTQWVDNLGKTTPEFVANTTLESFNQGPTPPTNGKLPYKPLSTEVSSSCLKCHSTATSASGGSADFSFVLGTAQ